MRQETSDQAAWQVLDDVIQNDFKYICKDVLKDVFKDVMIDVFIKVIQHVFTFRLLFVLLDKPGTY